MLKIMSFNVRGAFSQDGVNLWSERAPLNVAVIEQHAPDVIGFQELHAANLETYQHQLAAYDYFLGPPYDFKKRHAYNAIFWRKERFDLLTSGGFYLSETPDIAWSKGWDAALPRTAVWLTLNDKLSNLPFLIINAHLDHRGVQARQKSGQLIQQRAAELSKGKLPIFVTGDFNSNAWWPATVQLPQVELTVQQMPNAQPDKIHQAFLYNDYQDCFLAAGNVDSIDSYTFHGFQGTNYQPQQFHLALRIDWILFHDSRQQVHIHKCQIVRDAAPPRFPSDHYPLMATVTLTPTVF